MKIIYLNAWHAKMRENLAKFLKLHAEDTDVFCFQEAYEDVQQLCAEILTGYDHQSAYKFVTSEDEFPQSTYLKKGLDLVTSGTILESDDGCGLGLYLQINTAVGDIYVCNFHGMSRPANKLDEPGRLKSSQALIDFFGNKQGYKVIGGDFNLLPDTKSIAMFTESNYSNLISNFKIETTRNHLAWDAYPNNIQLHSDYIFTSNEVKVVSLKVPNIEVSDHLPLILEIKS